MRYPESKYEKRNGLDRRITHQKLRWNRDTDGTFLNHTSEQKKMSNNEKEVKDGVPND
jgi:hypothetical protein